MEKRLSWDEMMKVPVKDLNKNSFVPVRIIEDTDDMFRYLARYTVEIIKRNNELGKMTRIVWPCGPKRHFPYVAEITNRERVSWKNTVNFQMDEFLDWKGRYLPVDHPFNLQSYLRRELIARIDEDLRPDEDRLVFHDPLHIEKVDKAIDEVGGIDVVFGGFGYTGHFAYNEPPTSRWVEITQDEFLSARTHIVPTNDETFVMHSHRSAGGNFRMIPPCGITLGLKDLLSAEKIRLVSDGGAWKQTIFRLICMHEPTIKYPATFVQGHRDVEIIVDGKTAASPPDLYTTRELY